MSRFATVKTIDGYDNFELRTDDFVEVYGASRIFNRVTRTEMRRVLKAVDKFTKANPKPYFGWPGESSDIIMINAGYRRRRINSFEWAVRLGEAGEVRIGCKHFDQGAVAAIRKWAYARTSSKAKKTAKKAA